MVVRQVVVHQVVGRDADRLRVDVGEVDWVFVAYFLPGV
ncbi:MAG: hypothetical protein RL750_840, partial [Bacteroidota bacterium]